MFVQVHQLWVSAIRYGERHGHDKRGVGRKELLNNAQWLDKLNVLEFLKIMGNGMRLGTMLGRDTVRNKMEKGDGMSFAEFTYPLLQAWDWWQMYQERGVQIQIGGSDQYGNIVAGIDAVKYIAQNQESHGHEQWLDRDGRLKEDVSPMGLTVPLLTTSSGEKFGKSAGNAIWLDRHLTSPFDLYGFLLMSSDDDVEKYLKLFTFVPTAEIESIMVEHRADPGKRKAQHLLAVEVLELVHGPEEASKTRSEHQVMRNPTIASLSEKSQTTPTSGQSLDSQRIRLPLSLVHKAPFGRILYHAGLAATKSEGARTISKGGAYVASVSRVAAPGKEGELNFVTIKDQSASDMITDGLLILRIGKWKVYVIEVLPDDQFDAQGRDAPGWMEYKSALNR
ncbi:Tyrosine--tRNA ligase, mitochondrial [Lecanosticta acicola]|uniref:Tyrosine--tRNA ligase n=1 Tax=Lecanosticta acicola TaxID=111012 RepID=A0AAI8Z669_9PEZI|nr:Tyrosine--tRNA ligase, mitochondrial [Lecanosticta acicola]